jgi:hypothetical protein
MVTEDQVRERLEYCAVLVQAVEAGAADEEKGMAGAPEDVPEEQDEVLLGVEADAVVHPRAMVVHPGDTVLAY